MSVELITQAETPEGKERVAGKLEELKFNLARNNVTFSYRFTLKEHARCIETDTGWKIMIDRGLDIYQKPEAGLNRRLEDQAKRCKKTTIVYFRTGS